MKFGRDPFFRTVYGWMDLDRYNKRDQMWKGKLRNNFWREKARAVEAMIGQIASDRLLFEKDT